MNSPTKQDYTLAREIIPGSGSTTDQMRVHEAAVKIASHTRAAVRLRGKA